MPRTKKTVEEAVKTVEAAVAAPAAEEKPVVKKARAAKKAVEKAVDKAAAKVAEKKKAAAEKPARAKKAAAKVVFELDEKTATPDELIERAKADWTAKGNALDAVKSLSVYVNAGEGKVYYVVNDDYLSGSFDF